jgi:hypothetical protein
MKFKLLLCGVALFVAGCDTPQNPFVRTSDYSFEYDEVPQPVPDLTPGDLDKLYLVAPSGSVQSSYSALGRNSGSSGYGDR